MSITKVAKAAGVSHATVSNVINNRPSVAPATAEAVRRTIRELNYTPRPVGSRPGRRPRSADGIRTGVVTLLCRREPEGRRQVHPMFMGLMQGVADELEGAGLELAVRFTEPGHAGEVDKVAARSDGLLVISFHERATLDGLRGRPVVWIGSQGPLDWGDRVRSDHAQIARDAAGYLVDHGRSELIYVNLDVPHPAFEQRRAAFRDEAERLGLPLTVVAPTARPAGDDATLHGRAAEAAAALGRMDLDRAGLFVACDRQLVAFDRECRRAGLDLTGRLPTIACDNDAAALAGVVPAPATFDLSPELMGRLAVRRLAERMKGDATAGQLTICTPAVRVDPEPTPAG